MPWNEPGKDKQQPDPWKDNEGPPDLDAALSRIWQKLSGLFGGGGSAGEPDSGGSSFLFWLIPVALVVWVVFDAFHVIDEPERGVVLRFGQYSHTLQPGPNFTWPRPIDEVYTVDVQQIRSATSSGSMLTKDENIIRVDMAVQYRVNDANNYLFQVKQPDETLQQAADAAMRQVVGDSDLDFVLGEGRGEVAQQIKDQLQQILDRYVAGLELTSVNLQEVRPPAPVQEAFDDAVSAREDRERLQNEAEAYANSVIPEARGRAARVVEEAQGYSAARVAEAQGEAERFSLLLEEYLAAPEVTRTRLYLETLEQVLAESSKILMGNGESSGNNVLFLPLDQLMRGASAARSETTQQGNRSPFATPEDRIESRSGRSPNRRGRNGG